MEYLRSEKEYIYLNYVCERVESYFPEAQTMLDVGSNTGLYLKRFEWIPSVTAIDILTVPSFDFVNGIKANFLEHDFEGQSFEVVTCLQMLEHVKNPRDFFVKMVELTKGVLIVSLPYKWSADSIADHIHDPIDDKKMMDWFGAFPTHCCTITEPENRGIRVICLFRFYDEKQKERYYG